MDKVIIDGIDISGCDSYTHNHNELMPYGDFQVTEHYCWHVNSECNGKDCEYKQLQRAKAELKRKELECSSLIDEIAELREQLDDCYKPCKDCSTTHSLNLEVSENKQLKAENERLKEEINRNGREWENHCNALYWQMQSVIDKYSQCLKEIRDIASFHTSNADSEDVQNDMNDIIAKINEVIGVDNV